MIMYKTSFVQFNLCVKQVQSEINKMIEHLKLEDTLIATFRPVLRLKVKSWNQNP